MADRPQLQRLRRRGRHLPSAVDWATARRDPSEVVGETLAPLQRVSWVVGAMLTGLAAAPPTWTGDGRAALLAGLPAAAVLICAAVGRSARRRRVAMVLATSACGFLALTTVASLGALGELLGSDDGAPQWALGYPVACFAVSGAFLALAWPAWRRANTLHDEARAAAAMYDEL